MASRTGTYSLADLQAATVPGQIDEAAVTAALVAETNAHNAAVAELVSELCEITTDRERSYGTGVAGEMNRADDFARAQTQKGSTPGKLALPFEKWIYATGWTDDFRRKASPAKYAEVFVGARRAHVRAIQTAIRDAIFVPTNYTFVDYMDSKLPLDVKRFLNGDGGPIGEGPNGEVFASNHSHYLANAGLTAAVADSAVTTIVEHGHGQRVRVHINAVDAPAWTGLTGFVPALPVAVQPGSGVTTTAQRLDTSRLTNRFLGLLASGAELWSKPWVYPGKAFVCDLDGPKPLGMREDIQGSSALALGQLISLTPLSAQHYVARFGVGVLTRTNGAVVDFVNSTYTAP